MDTSFPVIAVAKNALKMPFESPKDIFKGIGLLLLSIILGTALFVLLLLANSASSEALSQLPAAIEAGNYEEMMALGLAFFFGVLILIVVVVLAVAHIFNYWVRFSAFGKDGAKFDSTKEAFKAAFINMLKLILIGILIGIVSGVLQALLSTLGLVDSFSDQINKAVEGDVSGQVRGSLLSTVLSTLVTCLIYSLFSANLTQTAVGNDKEGLEHPHTMDFAFVLVLLYGVVLVPTLLAGVLGFEMLMNIFNFVLGFYIMFVVGSAHGLRYRICMHELSKAEDTE